MGTAAQSEVSVRFDKFELKVRTRELYSEGSRLKIRGHPVDVLAILLEHPGELVTREELQKRLWPTNTFVDFEQILNNSIGRLRDALNDHAESPKFIETLPRFGYRFICPVESSANPSHADCPAQVELSVTAHDDVRINERSSQKKLRIALAETALAVAVAVWLFWYVSRPLPMARVVAYTRITTDGQWKRVAGTDGTDVYLNLFVPNGHGVVPASGGRVVPFSIDLPSSKDFPNDNPQILDVSPGGSKLLVGSNWNPISGRDLWIVDSHGGEARYLAKGFWATWSPDGGTVAYSTLQGELCTIPSEGGESKLLLASPTSLGTLVAVTSLAWSPDGRRIRFVRNERFWEVTAEGKNPHEILPNWHASNPRFFMGAGHWTPDGAFFLFIAGAGYSQHLAAGQQIWALDERRSWLHRSNPEPFELTSGATVWGGIGFAISRDGRTIYPTGMIPRDELVKYDAKTKALSPYLGGVSAEGVAFSKNGRYLVYVTFPEGEMWRANRDGSGRLQLTRAPLYPVNPIWSPDGAQILFFDWSPHERGIMYTLSSQGGTPKRLLPGDKNRQLFPDWSPDGTQVVFEQVPAGVGKLTSGTDFNIGAHNRILELDTGKLSDLPPCPTYCVMPRWSPDGRYILSMTYDNDLALYDFRTNKWSLFGLRNSSITAPRWSSDGRSVYFGDYDYPGGFFKSHTPGIYRVAVTGGKAEKVVDLSGFRSTGNLGGWIGIDPDGNLLLAREAGTYDIYALSLERK